MKDDLLLMEGGELWGSPALQTQDANEGPEWPQWWAEASIQPQGGGQRQLVGEVHAEAEDL